MLRSAFLIILTLAFTATCFADDIPDRKTSLKSYHVGNIVSATAMKASLGGKTTSDEWASEYAETIKSLNELQELAVRFCEETPCAIRGRAFNVAMRSK